MEMRARFSSFVVTAEQIKAWEIGFGWIHQLATQVSLRAGNWLVVPEFTFPLVSGRPDLVLVSPNYLFVIEMKTGASDSRSAGRKQVLEYAQNIWGKLRAARERVVIPILMSDLGKKKLNGIADEYLKPTSGINHEPDKVLELRLEGIIELVNSVCDVELDNILDVDEFSAQLLFSPRPSVVEAAISLVAGAEDKNVVTGLAEEAELERIISLLREYARSAKAHKVHQVVVVSGPPGSGKTLIGLRLAHDIQIQSILSADFGTPLYLTGNGPLVEVLVESLARDDHRRNHTPLPKARANSNSKVRLVHGVTEEKLGIESNIIVFDEGQRIWTEEHMRLKKGDSSLGSEAQEILGYLEKQEWALAVVLLGEGQEINKGEEGLVTWLKAIDSLSAVGKRNWKITSPGLPGVNEHINHNVDQGLRLRTAMRTDNAANVADWVQHLLNFEIAEAAAVRETFSEFPIYVTRNLEVAKKWLRSKSRSSKGTTGFVASAKSKRLKKFGIDVVSDASRSFNWGSWYLDKWPNLNSSEALEVAASEYKCQGLELDWVGVCWSWDMIVSGGKWQPRKLDESKAKWTSSSQAPSAFQVNAYRVLLTRARRGIVIWVPNGDNSDPSTPNSDLDNVATILEQAGASPLE